MRSWRPFLFAVLVLLLAAPGARGDDGGGHPAAPVAEKALDALRLRMEARIQEGELLARSGRIEEALEAYRSVGALYDQGMAQVQRLVADLCGAAPAAAVLDAPALGERPAAPQRRSGREEPPASLAPVDLGLRWLAAHQSPSGKWGATEFADWCDGKPILGDAFRPVGLGQAVNDVGLTGLALLAFLGAGHTARTSDYALTVKKGLQFLTSAQDAEGCIGPRTSQQFIYGHAVASLALLEAYGMTRSPLLEQPCQKALDFIATSRNPYFAWRYGVKPGDNDTSITVWMVMALRSAVTSNRADLEAGRPATFQVDVAAFDGARAWLDKMTDPDYGRVGYIQRGTGPARMQEAVDTFPAEKSEAMTAAAIFARVLMGEDPRKSDILKKGAQLCMERLPVWNPEDGSIDMVYWYFGTLAMYQVGGRAWQKWSRAMPSAMVETQRLDGDVCRHKGSWDPAGAWGAVGGRVYSTAMMCLCLEVNYRFFRLFGPK